MSVNFVEEIESVLPAGIPHRDTVVAGCALHLGLIEEANRSFNLTRITSPREAAIKHVVDCLLPWRWFEDAGLVVDVGSGAGYPGIPLALALPETRFVLSESIQKKARFLESAVARLQLPNAEVTSQRAETYLESRRAFNALLTARAVAPLTRLIPLFAPAMKRGASFLLFKGPDAQSEINEAESQGRKFHVRAELVETYELPHWMGVRSLVRLTGADSQ